MHDTDVVKNYMNKQKKITEEYADRVVNTVQESADILAKARDELIAFMEKNVSTVVDRLKQAQATAARAGRVAESARQAQSGGQ